MLKKWKKMNSINIYKQNVYNLIVHHFSKDRQSNEDNKDDIWFFDSQRISFTGIDKVGKFKWF